jgi:hypothetical protein
MMITKHTKVKTANWAITTALLTVFALSSCFNDNEDIAFPDTAFVSIYHGSPDAPDLDIYAESKKITRNPLLFSEILPYSEFFAANRLLRFNPYNAVNTLLEVEQTFEKDKIYSIFLVNAISEIDALVVEDKWEEPDGDKAQVRLVHISPDAGELEVSINGTGELFGESNPYLDITEFKKVEKGKVSITVKSKLTNEVLTSVNNIDLKGNRVYSLLIRGFKDPAQGTNQLNIQLVTNYIKF